MKQSKKLIFFNFFRDILRRLRVDYFFPVFTKDKNYNNFFVKCIPQNYQYPKNSFRRVNRNGIWFELDLSEYMEWVIYYGLSVENRSELYNVARKGMVMFDVGSNIGETLLNFALLVGDEGKVFGFEPIPLTFEKCSNNISLNNFSNITISQIALSNREETLFFEDPNNNNSGGVFMNKKKTTRSHTVQAITLDAFVKNQNLKKIELIKIDVEGFESNVLKGAEMVCKELRPNLFVEVDDDNLKRQGSSEHELLDLITSYGYRISKVNVSVLLDTSVSHYDIYAEPI